MVPFKNKNIQSPSLLPHDGTVHYFGKIFNEKMADQFYKSLEKNIPWKNDEVVLFGKRISTKRLVAWYGDSEFEYSYSKTKKRANLWTPELLRIKQAVEAICGESFNSCLLNLYPSGAEGMGWHTDAEKELEPNGAIASVSLGAERRFLFKHKQSKEKVAILLEHGSLLIMKGTTQQYWWHSLPKTKKILGPRINLTFRTIVKQ
jgi:alkylated DNA repair dioxygenase AlkB